LLCLNFFLCGADGNPLELYFLALIPASAYTYLYFYPNNDKMLFQGIGAIRGLDVYRSVLVVWFIYSKSIVFLEDRRRPII
jgi:hypothetical protein